MGLFRNFELRLGFNSFKYSRAADMHLSGLDDMDLGGKTSLLQDAVLAGVSKVNVSLLVGATFPTGSRSIGEKTTRPWLKIAADCPLNDRAGLSSNLVYVYAAEEKKRFHQLAASVSLGARVSNRMGWFGEVYGFFSPDVESAGATYFHTGVTQLLGDCLQVDLRIGRRIDSADADYFAGAGFGWLF
jgi:hypothetical protein